MRVLYIICLTMAFSSLSSFATDGTTETISGKITEFQTHGDHGSTYFKIDTVASPAIVWFYISDASMTGTSNGCTRKPSDTRYQAVLSTLMLAYSLNKTIEMKFCRDTANYGLITNTTYGYINLKL